MPKELTALVRMMGELTEGAFINEHLHDVEETMTNVPEGSWQLILAIETGKRDEWEQFAREWRREHEDTEWLTTMDAWESVFGEPWQIDGAFEWYVTDNVDNYAYSCWSERGDVVELIRFHN